MMVKPSMFQFQTCQQPALQNLPSKPLSGVTLSSAPQELQ
jgi:hypothetical protein